MTSSPSVVIVASKPLRAGHHTFVMFADFGEGLRYSLGAGSNPLRIPSGSYHLRMFSQLDWMRVAKADLGIEIRDEPLTIHYATPYPIFGRGAVGLVPQRRPIRGLLVGVLVVALLGLVVGLLTYAA